jgi:hypothetical protein
MTLEQTMKELLKSYPSPRIVGALANVVQDAGEGRSPAVRARVQRMVVKLRDAAATLADMGAPTDGNETEAEIRNAIEKKHWPKVGAGRVTHVGPTQLHVQVTRHTHGGGFYINDTVFVDRLKVAGVVGVDSRVQLFAHACKLYAKAGPTVTTGKLFGAKS